MNREQAFLVQVPLPAAVALSLTTAAHARARLDAWITRRAKTALHLAGDVRGTAINADTVNGRVTLCGTVLDKKEKTRAAEEAAKIEGVNNVASHDGVVTLFGRVPSQDSSSAAVELARGVAGVKRADDQIEVVSAARHDRVQARDEEIRADVN